MYRLKLLIFLSALLFVACGTAKSDLEVTNVAATRALFIEQKCVTCHGEKGEGGIGPSFKAGPAMSRSIEDIAARISAGAGVMPSFRDTLTKEQIQELAKYVYKELQGR